MAGAEIALQHGYLNHVGVVDFVAVTAEVEVLGGNRGDGLGKIPALQDALANHRMDLVDDEGEAVRILQQGGVAFRIGQDRQGADLVDQAGECRLLGSQSGVVAAQHVADAGHLQALAPDFVHLALDES
ncbi:hypothetical protein D9M71_662150 [compost metagenome]